MATIICKNCTTHFKGKFCPSCGQAAKTDTISLHYLLHDIPHSIFHVDKGFLYTLKKMFTNPGLALKEYMAGKRVAHFRPFAFVIIMSTVSTLLVPQIEKLIYQLFIAKNPGYGLSMKVLFWEKYFSLLIFLLIPILSLITWLCFKRKPYNYWEHFVGNTYMAAQLNVLQIFAKLFTLFKVALGYNTSLNYAIFMFGYMFYYSYCFRVWMAPHKNRWSIFLVLLIMNFLLSLVYLTGLSLAGIIEPWWGS
jgi:hypothetical protein